MYHTAGKQYMSIEEEEPIVRIDTVMKGVRMTSDCEKACTEDTCTSGGANLLGVKFEIMKNCISCNKGNYEYDFNDR